MADSGPGGEVHEIVMLRDGLILRVSSRKDVPLELLSAALDEARPMDDRHYRHLLLGEKGAYIREYDGNR